MGISMSIPTSASAALGAVPPAELGTASGVNNTMGRFGGAFGVAIVTAVFSAHGSLASAAGGGPRDPAARFGAPGVSLAGAGAPGARRRRRAGGGVGPARRPAGEVPEA